MAYDCGQSPSLLTQGDRKPAMKDRLCPAVALSVCLTTLYAYAGFESFYQHDSAQAKSIITQSNGKVL